VVLDTLGAVSRPVYGTPQTSPDVNSIAQSGGSIDFRKTRPN